MHLIPNKFDASVAFVVCEKPNKCFVFTMHGNSYLAIHSNGVHTIPLPPGDWEICFKHSEATYKEEQSVVEKKKPSSNYRNYAGEDKPVCWNATDSYHSLLRAHGIDPTDKDIIVIKRN